MTHHPKITKEQFLAKFSTSIERLAKDGWYLEALPCDPSQCGYSQCQGWAISEAKRINPD